MKAKENKYLVTGCKEVEVGGKWYMKTTSKAIKAEDKTEAEWKMRELGYTPLNVKKMN